MARRAFGFVGHARIIWAFLAVGPAEPFFSGFLFALLFSSLFCDKNVHKKWEKGRQKAAGRPCRHTGGLCFVVFFSRKRAS